MSPNEDDRQRPSLAKESGELPDPAGQLGDQRDQRAQRRDLASADRDEKGARRDEAGNLRDQASASRDHWGTRRDGASQRRDEVADRRDDAADVRDVSADLRDQAADQRDQMADDRDQLGDRSVIPLNERITADALHRSELARVEAASDRRGASRDRQAAAYERVEAERDRVWALSDREVGADERSLASADRTHSSADRMAGASERTDAGHDRDTASMDRDASAKDRDSASTDGLTGVYRRDFGLVELSREVARAERTSGSLALAFVDVDNLKAVNDTAGHPAGDQRLKDVAQALVSALRPYDLVLRYGGDEFVCAVSGLAQEELAHRLAGASATLGEVPRQASVTVGFAAWEPGDDAESLIARADAALYEKRKQRLGLGGTTQPGSGA